MKRGKEEGLKQMLKKKKKERKTWRVKKLFKWVTSLKLESVKKKKNYEERWNVMLKKKI